MSYILEALKKSEQERHIGHVPDLTVTQEPAPAARSARWPWLLVAALLLNAVIVGLVVWKPWQAPTPVATTDGPPPPVAEASPPLPTGRVATEAAVEGPAPAAPPPAALAPEASIALEPAGPAPAAPQPEEPATAAELSPADWRAATPRWRDLPAEERSRLPVPRLDVHVFAQEPSRRFVLVNLKKYQEGDRLDQGVTLDAILADGVVLSYQGQRYRVDRP